MPNVVLKIDGTEWAGWQQIQVVRSLRQGADTFELALTDRWAAGARPRPIRADAACQVLLDGHVAITGYVFEVSPSYDAGSHSIKVSGLSKAADLIDSSLPGQQWSDRTLLQIAQELGKPFGINATAEAGADKKIARAVLEPGQTVFGFLEELSRAQGVRLVSKPNGGVAFVRAGAGNAAVALVLGENIKAASGRLSTEKRHSQYHALGQHAGSDLWNGTDAAHASAVEKDGRIRHRPLTLIADGNADGADCKTRCAWEKQRRCGESQTATYTVQGWTCGDGLWQPNTLVQIRDPFLGIDDRC
ncbi:phage baseplate assembly protein [Methylogaea oryzae]|uniref:phage baseplate assembly protein n=1 Tax=Methylogaea oryzae TaxID=1295382 RepID=UPI0012E0EB55|nr:hypothetical protein [Methylogaea oryzae]